MSEGGEAQTKHKLTPMYKYEHMRLVARQDHGEREGGRIGRKRENEPKKGREGKGGEWRKGGGGARGVGGDMLELVKLSKIGAHGATGLGIIYDARCAQCTSQRCAVRESTIFMCTTMMMWLLCAGEVRLMRVKTALGLLGCSYGWDLIVFWFGVVGVGVCGLVFVGCVGLVVFLGLFCWSSRSFPFLVAFTQKM